MEKMVRSYDDKRCWRYTGNGMSYLSLYVFSGSGYLSQKSLDLIGILQHSVLQEQVNPVVSL